VNGDDLYGLLRAEIEHLETEVEHLEGLRTVAARERHALLDRLAHYRHALARIADAESGHWGHIARAALDGEQDRP